MKPDRILRIAEVTRRVGMSRSWVYQKMAEGTFPPSIQLGARAIGWFESEINDYIMSLKPTSKHR